MTRYLYLKLVILYNTWCLTQAFRRALNTDYIESEPIYVNDDEIRGK